MIPVPRLYMFLFPRPRPRVTAHFGRRPLLSTIVFLVLFLLSFAQPFELPPVPKENIPQRRTGADTVLSSSSSGTGATVPSSSSSFLTGDTSSRSSRQQRSSYRRRMSSTEFVDRKTEDASLISEEIDINAPEAPPGTLLLPGRRFPFRFESGEFTIHDMPIYINETNYDASKGTHGGTGLLVWDGSIVLAKYLEYRYPSLEKKAILEIGSGTGIVGLTSSILGGNVVLTDLAYCLPNLQQTIDKNKYACKGTAQVHELNWEKLPSSHPSDYFHQQSEVLPYPFDMIVGADVVWVPELIEPLVQTLNWLVPMRSTVSSDDSSASSVSSSTSAASTATVKTEILIAHKTRSRLSDELFFKLLKDYHFSYNEIPLSLQHPNFQDNDIRIFRIERTS